jgi:hypothetical protein
MDKLTRGLAALEDENEILRAKNAQLEKDVRLGVEGCVFAFADCFPCLCTGGSSAVREHPSILNTTENVRDAVPSGPFCK